jgi:atlastin
VLLDTQGTFDSQTSMKENTFIFALSTLLSSVQIYNLQDRIQMDDLSNLQVFK